jgi:hypothetical protein
MKPEYDFSKAEMGKFYSSDATFNFPLYLDSDVEEFMLKIAQERNIDLQSLVNEWLKANIQLIQSLKP